jgi:hypothetical protein
VGAAGSHPRRQERRERRRGGQGERDPERRAEGLGEGCPHLRPSLLGQRGEGADAASVSGQAGRDRALQDDGEQGGGEQGDGEQGDGEQGDGEQGGASPFPCYRTTSASWSTWSRLEAAGSRYSSVTPTSWYALTASRTARSEVSMLSAIRCA